MLLWSGIFVNNRVPLVEVGYYDNVFQDNIFFKYGKWLRYPFYKGSLLYSSFFISSVRYLIFSLVYVVEIVRLYLIFIVYKLNKN